MSKVPYTSVVGCMMYTIVCTRPDLVHAVSKVSKYMTSKHMTNRGREHWKTVEWMFRYFRGTIERGIMFGREHDNIFVEKYVDANYAGDVDDRRSYVFTLAGGPICGRSMVQSLIALSTIEANYVHGSHRGSQGSIMGKRACHGA